MGDLPVLVINLARSPDRWKAVSESGAGLDLRRIEAVDGRTNEDRSLLARMRFEMCNGRTALPGEYGCYLSHLAALTYIVENDLPAAIIVEDDIRLTPNLPDRAVSLLATFGDGAIKLVHHRARGFVSWGRSAKGDEYGRTKFGPQGSAACYAVTNRAARRLLETLKVMWLPWDVALERGWDTGVPIYTVREPLVGFNEYRATSTLTSSYDGSRFKWWRRSPVLVFRLEETLWRLFHVLTTVRRRL